MRSDFLARDERDAPHEGQAVVIGIRPFVVADVRQPDVRRDGGVGVGRQLLGEDVR